jgi:hypothetical protein
MHKVHIISQKKRDTFHISKYYGKDYSYFTGFNEVYFSHLKKNIFKGYHFNSHSNSNLSVVKGKVTFYIKNKKKIKRITLKDDLKKILIIKKKTFYGFKAAVNSLVINVSTGNKNKKLKR